MQIVTSIVVIGFMIVVPIVWDLVVVATGNETISQMFRRMGHTKAIVIYGVSVLPGHWWVNFEKSIPDMIAGPDASSLEFFMIFFFGWSIHWLSVYNEWQLGPLQSLALVIFSVLVGALFWTMSPVNG